MNSNPPKMKYHSKAHQEGTEQKMQEYNQKEKLAVAEMMKSPMSSEEMDRVIQEHYEAHSQVNPNKMRHMVSIWRNRGQEDEMHMRVEVSDEDYQRMIELVKTEKLTSTEAYDKMKTEKIFQ